ncbi:S41 family peptidase [uncultured Dubosiella sp.]|jgi:carboxyl-terminal processing protease|uniref:S41 family peptidase n=2 Tax=uncultured Dubosiella sp. TaxID=1937011 RepID=UPI00208901BD|nr:S41 family peptidase [uncultured Dubosiella sp.]GJM58918.1 S41 family peptidase [Erysipelotrichaceae bacterium OPF54]
MKKAKKPSEKLTRKEKGAITGLCILCFGAGILVPVTLEKTKPTNTDEFSKLETVYDIMKNKWYYADQLENGKDQLVEQAISGMTTNEIDLHTTYMGLDQAQQFSNALSGSNVGIGIQFFRNAEGNMEVRGVFINSAADKAGLQDGDIITKVGSLDCAQATNDEIINAIRNHADQSLKVDYVRNGQERSCTVEPGDYDTTVICNVFDGYGEIILSSFSEDSGKDFKEAVSRIRKAGIRKLIIDLRDNTGGYLDAAQQIASVLLPKGSTVFKEKQKDGTITETLVTDDEDPAPFDQIVILQNENTASASEVLIGALKDNLADQVTTVGTTTYGKGTKQVLIPFDDGTSLKYTETEWLTPDETSINKSGFVPDVEVAGPEIRAVYYSSEPQDLDFGPDEVAVNARPAQLYLSYLGYGADRTDTYFSRGSSEALKQFQRDHDLNVTGRMDENTWKVLEENTLLELNKRQAEEDEQRNRAVEIVQ